MTRRRLNDPVPPPARVAREPWPPPGAPVLIGTSCPVRYEPSCGACRFWLAEIVAEFQLFSVNTKTGDVTPCGTNQQGGTDTYGRCRRHAPVQDRHDNGGRRGWPQATADDWCGDFQPRRGAR